MANVLDLKNLPASRASGEAGAPVELVPPTTMAAALAAAQPEPQSASEPEPVDDPADYDVGDAGDATLAGAVAPTMIAWEAHHKLDRAARYRHYMLLGSLVVIGAIIGFWQSSIMVFVTVVAGVAALEVRERWSTPVQISVHEHGIDVDGHTYAHADFASFDLHRMPDDTAELSLRTNRWHIPHLRLPMGEQDAHEVHAVLAQYVPRAQHKIPLLDYLIRKRP